MYSLKIEYIPFLGKRVRKREALQCSRYKKNNKKKINKGVTKFAGENNFKRIYILSAVKVLFIVVEREGDF